jgi:hypothetical protein
MSEQQPHTTHTEAELIERVRSIDVRAPEELRRRVQALVDERASGSQGHRGAGNRARRSGTGSLKFGGAIVAAAAIAAILVLALAGGGSSGLSVRRASALTLSAATMAAPSENQRALGTLQEAVDGVAFPYWKGRFGWRASGARSDQIDGRAVRTVFYSDGRGQRIGYAIVAGTPAPAASGGAVVWRAGTPYRLLSEHGVSSVVWLRSEHLCVVAGRGVSSATLLALASWREHPGTT